MGKPRGGGPAKRGGRGGARGGNSSRGGSRASRVDRFIISDGGRPDSAVDDKPARFGGDEEEGESARIDRSVPQV